MQRLCMQTWCWELVWAAIAILIYTLWMLKLSAACTLYWQQPCHTMANTTQLHGPFHRICIAHSPLSPCGHLDHETCLSGPHTASCPECQRKFRCVTDEDGYCSLCRSWWVWLCRHLTQVHCKNSSNTTQRCPCCQVLFWSPLVNRLQTHCTTCVG